MCKEKLKEIADNADMIASGYAFKNFGGGDFFRG